MDGGRAPAHSENGDPVGVAVESPHKPRAASADSAASMSHPSAKLIIVLVGEP